MIAVAKLAFVVGLAGLLPFLAAVGGLLLAPGQSPIIIAYFYLYSAGILAFMAGVYWPLSLQLENRCYPLSPLVTLLISQAFFLAAGLGLLLPVTLQIPLYTSAYLALYLVDARLLRTYWPDWYRKLRLLLTAVVIGSQLAVGGWYLLNQ